MFMQFMALPVRPGAWERVARLLDWTLIPLALVSVAVVAALAFLGV